MLAVFALAATLTTLHAAARPIVEKIEITGNTKTLDSVIRNELETRPGGRFDSLVWENDVQRVKDLNLFWTTRVTAETRPSGISLFLTVEEKWTLIPLLGFNRSGGITEWSAGLYEANILGTHAYGQILFSRKAEGNTYVLSFGNHRVGKSRFYYSLEARRALSVHTLYDARGPGDAPRGYYSFFRESFYGEMGTRLDHKGEHRLGLVYFVRRGRYDLVSNTEEQRAVNARFRVQPPPARIAARLGLTFSAGRVHYDDYVYKGRTISAFAATSAQLASGPRRFERISGSIERFYVPFARHNVGLRAAAAATGSKRAEDKFALGGLGEVRGFPDERFRGANLWNTNAEYRYPVVDHRWVMLQAVALSDAGWVWDGGFVSRAAVSHAALSLGGGLRGILKPVYSAMIRIDYAQTLSPYRRNGYSLGVLQFF